MLGIGVDLGPDQLEFGLVVEDRGDHLGANRAGAPLVTRYGGCGDVTSGTLPGIE
jgi:hypothetical protein